MRNVLVRGSTPNDVFGLKLMWNYFGDVVTRLRELPGCEGLEPHEVLPAVFPAMRYVWIMRTNKVRQAVSWAIAAQTNIYAAFQLEERDVAREPAFDFRLIDNLHGLVLKGEAGWKRYFESAGVEPLLVEYEKLAADYEGTALAVLRHIGVEPPDPLFTGEPRMSRQATALNDEWVHRYMEMKRSQDEVVEE